jgi:GxxExxY protein
MESAGKEFLYKELSYKIVGLCMEIQKEYGSFHRESIYHNVLKEKLEKESITHLSKPMVKVFSKETGNKLGYYVPDFLVENKIMVELKAKPVVFKCDEIQLSEYIKTTQYEVGYLINFGVMPLYFKRIIYTNDKKNLLLSAKN